MALREEQVELTRKRILDGVIEMSGEPGGGPVTVAEVSRRAGVSPATIYRHFPTREALVSAAATRRLDEQAASHDPANGEPMGLADLRPYLRALWGDLAEDLPLARQATISEAGRELRGARFARWRGQTAAVLRDAGVDPDGDDARHALACVDVLSSAHAFLDLLDRQELDVAEAVESVCWGIKTLVTALGIDASQLPIAGRAPGPTQGIAPGPTQEGASA